MIGNSPEVKGAAYCVDTSSLLVLLNEGISERCFSFCVE